MKMIQSILGIFCIAILSICSLSLQGMQKTRAQPVVKQDHVVHVISTLQDCISTLAKHYQYNSYLDKWNVDTMNNALVDGHNILEWTELSKSDSIHIQDLVKGIQRGIKERAPRIH
jgi:hypothetical protein